MTRSLGHYRIDAQIGIGGMGVVYRATDSRLGRSVAIKVVREELLQDTGLFRFEREARVLASLNHPNIAAIYGFEEQEGARFLVLEYVPGETLAEHLKRGALRVKETMAILKQIADALEAAHEKGVIHRDLKPANIMLSENGRVKVLDFGLAKVLEGDRLANLSSLETKSDSLTKQAVILGTASYMSPEQARGKPLDTRTDIWSFGCVLYEALTGERPFVGNIITEILAAILEREPNLDKLPADTPPNIRALVRRCLEKDPRCRLRDIGDARIELEEFLAGKTREVFDIPTSQRSRLKSAVAIALAAVIAMTAGFLIGRGYKPKPDSQQTAPPIVARLDLELPKGSELALDWAPLHAVSPDGSQVAFTGAGPKENTQIFLRRLDEIEAKPIEGTEDCQYPAFSPDGKSIAFWHYNQTIATLEKIRLNGGAPVKITDMDVFFGFDWGPKDTIVISNFDLFRVSASGGTQELLLKRDMARGERWYRDPAFLPGTEAVLFTISMEDTDSHDDGQIGLLDLNTGRKEIIIKGGMGARYSPSGHIIYGRKGKLLAVPFDLKQLEVTGAPFPVLEGVHMSATTGNVQFAISPSGTLVYAPGPVETGERLLTWVDRSGKATSFSLPARSYLHPRLSPDEQQLAVEVEGPTHNLFAYDFNRNTFTKLTFDGISHWPLWSPKGDRLAFRSMRTGFFTMWWMPWDRSASEKRLTDIGWWQSAGEFAPDGKALVFDQWTDPKTRWDVLVLPLEGENKPVPVAQSRFPEAAPRFSPDGRWIAYCSLESGRSEVYVQQWPGPGPKLLISTEGGIDPMWARKSGELFYRNGDKMMVCSMSTQPRLSASRPRLLWEGHFSAGRGTSCGPAGFSSSNYDVTADGKRFVMIQDKDEDVPATKLSVVLNWHEELKRRARARTITEFGLDPDKAVSKAINFLLHVPDDRSPGKADAVEG